MLEYREIRDISFCSVTATVLEKARRDSLTTADCTPFCSPDSECRIVLSCVVWLVCHCAVLYSAVPPGLRMGEAPGPAGEKFPVVTCCEMVWNVVNGWKAMLQTAVQPLFHLDSLGVLCFLCSRFIRYFWTMFDVRFMEFRSEIWHV